LQPRFGAVCFSGRRGVSNSSAERRLDTDQPFIEARDRRPLSAPGACTLGMYGLNSCFELKSANTPAPEGVGQAPFCLF